MPDDIVISSFAVYVAVAAAEAESNLNVATETQPATTEASIENIQVEESVLIRGRESVRCLRTPSRSDIFCWSTASLHNICMHVANQTKRLLQL